jgi:hypothetical protein
MAAMEDWSRGVILIDVPVGDAGEFDRDVLERIGHPVDTCHGPEELACPLLSGEDCPLFERAHGIVFRLDLDREDHRAILERYRDLAPSDTPIRVFVTPEQAERHAQLLTRFEIWAHEPTVADLDGFAAEVEAADRFVERPAYARGGAPSKNGPP